MILYLFPVSGFPPGESDLITEKFIIHELSRPDSYFIIFKYKLYFMAAML